MEDIDFRTLEAKVDELVALCDSLKRENRTLREQHDAWVAERAKLVERNELAKNRIDAMINRLTTLDEEL